MRPTKILAVFAALSLSAGPAWPELTRIGGAGAVKGAVNAVAPGTNVGRVVESGKPIFLNDHVTTKTESRLQVLLLDETVFTLGPDSDMVLDEFVYDPATSAGKATARLTKGVFRFVTGKVARSAPQNMNIKVPTGTIGIRGTKAVVEVKPDVSTVILEGAGKNNTANETPGRLEVSTGKGDSQMLTREAFGSDLKADQPATTPSDRSSDLARINGSLNPQPTSNATPAAGSGGGKKSDATSETGGVITALGSLKTTQTTNTQSNQASNTTTQSSQSNANSGGVAIPDGLTTWDFIRQQILTGQGYYFSGDAPINCSGCTAGSGSFGSLQLQINFGAQTAGGNGLFNSVSSRSDSFIHLHGLNTVGATDTIEQTINAFSFASFTGNAVVTLNPYLNATTSTSGGSGNFNGSTVALMNSGGVVAKNAVTTMQFSGQTSASIPASVSGQTFTSPRTGP